jgi:hypothetical protein
VLPDPLVPVLPVELPLDPVVVPVAGGADDGCVDVGLVVVVLELCELPPHPESMSATANAVATDVQMMKLDDRSVFMIPPLGPADVLDT